MIKNNSTLFPIIKKEDQLNKIYENTINKVNDINNRCFLITDNTLSDLLEPLVQEMNTFSKNLTENTSLENYMFFKMLIQKIEKILKDSGNGEDILPPLPETDLEPNIKEVTLTKSQNTLIGKVIFDKNEEFIVNLKYDLYKNNIKIETIETTSNKDTTIFTSKEPGTYYFTLNCFWNNGSKEVTSNTVTISEEVQPPVGNGEFPNTLPFSNLWAYTVEANGNYEITLNNTWGQLDSKVGVYLDGKLVELLDTVHTAINRGSAKNIVPNKYPTNKDLKIVYKVTYLRDEITKDNVTVYYKSTTGKIEITTGENAVKYCNYPQWNKEIEYGAATNKIVFHDGSHFRHTGWAATGDGPKINGEWSPWTKLSTSEELNINCTGHHLMDSLGKKPNAHLFPMNVSSVIGIGTPMEKMHVTYSAEWGKWGSRKYTPKISPWNKISHMQYAFVDVAPDYQNKFITNKDDISHLTKTANDVVLGAGNLNISPNIFDPGAAFSNYGGTNPYMTEFMEMAIKFPYVKAMASLGGWSRSGFFRDAASDSKREYFVKRCVDFIREFNFCGIDIDWEFPCAQRMGDLVDNKNDLGTPRAQDDENILFSKLMKSLRIALDNAGKEDGKYYFLSCAIVSGKNHIEKSGIEYWHSTCDYISYMTYDVHGAFDSHTNHQSYLFQNEKEPVHVTNPNGYAMSISNLIKYIATTYKISPKKINVGTPFYSRGWAGIFQPASGWLTDMPGLYAETNINAFLSGAKGCSAPGTMDGGRGAGVLALNHLNRLISGQNIRISNPENPHSGTTLIGADFKYYYDIKSETPYLYNEVAGLFYTFEDERSLTKKCQWVLENDLAGLISWDIGLDDYGVDMLSSEATTQYPILSQADHLLTSLIFDNFKSNSSKLKYFNRISKISNK